MLEMRLVPPTFRCNHRYYGMDCAGFDALLRRASGVCEMCGAGQWLGIDHDHRARDGWTGVRGWICAKCNAHMRRVDSGERIADERTQRYIDNAWHLTNPPVAWGVCKQATDSEHILFVPPNLLSALTEVDDDTLSEVVMQALESYVQAVSGGS